VLDSALDGAACAIDGFAFLPGAQLASLASSLDGVAGLFQGITGIGEGSRPVFQAARETVRYEAAREIVRFEVQQ
jgi:hypothetical protein